MSGFRLPRAAYIAGVARLSELVSQELGRPDKEMRAHWEVFAEAFEACLIRALELAGIEDDEILVIAEKD